MPGLRIPEHQTHADNALAELAAGLRADLAAARAAVENARNEQAAALRAQDRAQESWNTPEGMRRQPKR
ncbi:hypothetical protein HED51_16235 [Ochrobactrum grignonense]|nr:hypothetical protein [Brucella grignonensis]